MNMFADVWKQDYRAIYRSNMLLSSLDGDQLGEPGGP